MLTQPHIPDRTKAPSNGKHLGLHIPQPERLAMDNGLEAFAIHAGEEEVTRLDIIFSAGSAFQQKKLTAAATGKLIKEGTTHHSSPEIAGKLDYVGAYCDVQTTKDSATLTLYSLTRHLENLLPLITEMITQAIFPEHELLSYLNRKRQEFLVNTEKVRYRAMLEFNRLLFGENAAYGQMVDLPDFDLLKREDLDAFYHKNYTADNAYIIISGKADQKVRTLVNRYLGNGFLPAKGIKHDVVYVGNNGTRERFIEKKGTLQSAIRIGRPIINKLHPDYHKLVLVNTILGGYFGSRLMSNLREDKGYTYGVSSAHVNYKHGAALSIATEVNAKHTQSAIDQILLEMERLCKERVGEGEKEMVKNYIYGTFLRNFDGPFALADRFRSARDFGLGFDYYLDSLSQLMSVTANDVIETANKYLQPEDMIRLVVGSFE